MSAQRLRDAAALMRSRAEAASRGPWDRSHVGLQGGEQIHNHSVRVARVYMNESDGRPRENAEHIASWHPAVALAVADWLETCAHLSEFTDNGGPLMYAHALAVANAYLGTTS